MHRHETGLAHAQEAREQEVAAQPAQAHAPTACEAAKGQQPNAQTGRQAAPEPPNSNNRAHHRNPREHCCNACMRGCDACLADAMRDHSHTHTLHAACVMLPLHVRVAWFACLARVRRMCRGPHLPGAVRRCKAGTQPSFSVVHSRPGGAPPVAAAAGQHRQQAVQSLLPSLCRRHHHTRPPTLPTSCPTPDCRQPGHAQT
ncbi:hypothetical protein V8C86DRAFT_1381945 [Haematococcus lacustris]